MTGIDPAHLTDAELAAWYGSGLHAPKAQRLIEEVRRLRRELVLSAAQYAELERAELVREQERDDLRARLAEVEAERDEWNSNYNAALLNGKAVYDRMVWLEARLAAVLALCDDTTSYLAGTRVPVVWVEHVRAAARREGDRPHHFHMSSYVGPEPRCWCDRFASDPIHNGEGDR